MISALNTIKNKTVVLLTSMVMLVFILVNLQFAIDKRFPDSSLQESFLYLPSGQFIKGAALAYDEMVADFLWIKVIGYFATHAKTDRDYRWFNHFLNIITELDPYSQYVYEFGGIILSAEMEKPEKSTELMKKGMANVSKNHERYWKFPFFIAFNYMYYLKDFKKAAEYLEIAAKDPRSPTYLPMLVARLYANDKYHDTAIKFLYEMLADTQNPELRLQIETRINDLTNDRNIRILENARDQFYEAMGRYPFMIYELVIYGFINRFPDDIADGGYHIDFKDHSIFHSTLGGKLALGGKVDIPIKDKDNRPNIDITVQEKDKD
ncbi:MAG: hypothetical protein HQK62_12745 [Desulfamplus sp.]|nr:hypothetical protein [Desulfamplus sp.]